MPKSTVFDEARALCDTLSDEDDDMTRELLTRIADKWSVWVLSVLVDASAPVRFAKVKKQVTGISQKSLTKTLRTLERDGLVTRQMFLEVPPRVEYAITPLGLQLMAEVQPLWVWVAQHLAAFHAARHAFDHRSPTS